MAKKNTTAESSETTITTRKPRQARTLTDIEIEAKAQWDDARAVAKLMPLLDKLSANGLAKLAMLVEQKVAATAEKFEGAAQS